MLIWIFLLWNDWPPKSWTTPQEPFPITENVFYVGSQELSAYLIVGEAGMALINVGLEENAPMVLASIKQLGHNPKDLKYILVTQAHADHAGGANQLAQETGARILCGAADLKLMHTGGKDDHVFGNDLIFEPAPTTKGLENNQILSLGPIKIKTVATPGHTPGSTSYVLETNEGTLFFQASISLLKDTQLKNHMYPNLVQDFQNTFHKLESIHANFYLPDHMIFADPKDGSQANKTWFQSRDILSKQVHRSKKVLKDMLGE